VPVKLTDHNLVKLAEQFGLGYRLHHAVPPEVTLTYATVGYGNAG
jgi:hypothetical protein